MIRKGIFYIAESILAFFSGTGEHADHHYYYIASNASVLGDINVDVAIGNPLRGLTANPGFSNYDENAISIDRSLDIYYLGLNEIMVDDPNSVGAEKAFDWSRVESYLNLSASNSRHAILTVSVHIPGQEPFLPSFLSDSPLLEYPDTLGLGRNLSPDYSDPALLNSIEHFVRAFGEQYDGDTRIAFIHLGLLGFWG